MHRFGDRLAAGRETLRTVACVLLLSLAGAMVAGAQAAANQTAPTSDSQKSSKAAATKEKSQDNKADGGATTPQKTTTNLCGDDTPQKPPLDKTAPESRIEGVLYLAPPSPNQTEDQLSGEFTLEFLNRETADHRVYKIQALCRSGNSHKRFYQEDMPAGTYEESLNQAGRAPAVQVVTVARGETRRVDLAVDVSPIPMTKHLFWIPLVYLLTILLVRWNNFALPNRIALEAELEDVASRMRMAGFKDTDGPMPQILAARQHLHRWEPMEFLFWSRGKEYAGWQIGHQAELTLISHSTAERVDALMLKSMQQLADINTPQSNGLATRATQMLTPEASLEVRREVLIQLQNFIYEADDTGFSVLCSWQNKAFWLTLTGLLLIVGVGSTEDHLSLFIAGAVGGFLSRLMRQLTRANVPSDYGASWATLFLSPTAGALAGWFGCVLIMLLSDKHIGVLSGPLLAINWDAPNTAPVIGAAFLLGFSERLFDRIVGQLENTVAEKNDKVKNAAPPATVTQTAAAAAATNAPVTISHKTETVKAGSVCTLALAGVDLSAVNAVQLVSAANSNQTPASQVTSGASSVTFTIPPTTAAGAYTLLLGSAGGKSLDPARTINVIA